VSEFLETVSICGVEEAKTLQVENESHYSIEVFLSPFDCRFARTWIEGIVENEQKTERRLFLGLVLFSHFEGKVPFLVPL
jgi:hypothetical protein